MVFLWFSYGFPMVSRRFSVLGSHWFTQPKLGQLGSHTAPTDPKHKAPRTRRTGGARDGRGYYGGCGATEAAKNNQRTGSWPWLVGGAISPSWKMMEFVNGFRMTSHMKWKINNVWNHQPDDRIMRKDEGMEIHRTLGFGVDQQCKLQGPRDRRKSEPPTRPGKLLQNYGKIHHF